MAVLNDTLVNGTLDVTEEITRNGQVLPIIIKNGKPVAVLSMTFENGVLTITTSDESQEAVMSSYVNKTGMNTGKLDEIYIGKIIIDG